MKKIPYIISFILSMFFIINLWMLHLTCDQLIDIADKHTEDISYLNNKIELYIANNEKLQGVIKILEDKVNNTTLIKVTVTHYCPWARGINSDSDPTNTALMTTPKPGYTIAISKELVDKGWLGHKVYIEGFGIGRIEDRMGKSVTGNHIDICVGTEKEAMKFGKRNEVNMVKLL